MGGVGGGPLGLLHMKIHFWGGGIYKTIGFFFLEGEREWRGVGIPIFDFLEWWGHESPVRTFGMVGVLPTPLDFWEDGVLSAPLDCWDGGVLSTPLAFWDGGVVKGF